MLESIPPADSEKLYYTIGEVAKMFNAAPSLIRFWETEFDVLKPKKNKKGNRLFTRKDIENLKIIWYLVKEKGYTLTGAKEKIKTSGKEVEKNFEMVETLKKLKNFLIEVRDNLEPATEEDAPAGVMHENEKETGTRPAWSNQ